MKIGYARVSTKHQCESLDQQIVILKKAGCEEVYSEVISGAKSKRKELTLVLQKLKDKDTLTITSIDRLGRSLKDLISIITNLKERNIKFQSLKEQMDTSTDSGMLMFNMMGSIAEFERTLINRRIYDGVQRAKEQGKYKGKAYSVDQDIRKEYVDMLASGKYTASYIARMAKISRQTLYNWKTALVN
jgi:DNA invertase Pin-like site-specific DNA recombinase